MTMGVWSTKLFISWQPESREEERKGTSQVSLSMTLGSDLFPRAQEEQDSFGSIMVSNPPKANFSCLLTL